MTQENLSSAPPPVQEPAAAPYRGDAGPAPRRSAARRYALGILTALLLAWAVVGAYWQAFDCGFVNYDDDQYVYDNVHVQAGLTRDDVRWAVASTDTVNWYPLTWMSLELDSTLWGGVKPFGFHLTNVVLHIADTLLLFWVLTRMTGRMGRSAVVAGLFALHPLHVESVAWVTERKDVLSALFWMLALAAYVWYAKRPHWARYLLVAPLFALGLTAKSMLVTLPCVLFLLDYWPLRRYPWLVRRDAAADGGPAPGFRPAPVSWLRLIAEKIPLFVLSAASTAITIYAQQKGGESNPLKEMPVRIGNALVSYVAYIGKTVWPVGLVPYYPFPKEIRGGHISLFETSMAEVLLLSVTVVVLATARRRPYLAVGWFWFLGTLAPVIGIIQVMGDYAMADRFTYIPLIGLFIAVVWGAADWLARARVRPRLSAAAAVTLLIVFAVGTWHQVGYWHDSGTLWRHTLDVNPRNQLAYNNLGHDLYLAGKYPEAEWYFRKAIECDPSFALSHFTLAWMLEKEGRWKEAADEYRTAAYWQQGSAWYQYQAGHATFFYQGKVKDAIQYLEAALRIDPDYYYAHMDLALALFDAGDVDGSVRHYREAVRIDPKSSEAHDNLGRALLSRQDLDGAVAEFRAALAINPNFADAHYFLGAALIQQGREAEGEREQAEARRLSQPPGGGK